jgi:hypothetical protein
MRTKMMKLFAPLFAAAAVMAAVQLPAIGADMSPQVRVRVVDAATGAPLEGAVGVFSVNLWEGSFGGGRGKPMPLFRVSAKSDAKGEMTFAPSGVSDLRYGWFGWSTNYGGPSIAIGKLGYAAFTWTGRLYSRNLAEALEWEYPAPVTIRLARIR